MFTLCGEFIIKNDPPAFELHRAKNFSGWRLGSAVDFNNVEIYRVPREYAPELLACLKEFHKRPKETNTI